MHLTSSCPVQCAGDVLGERAAHPLAGTRRERSGGRPSRNEVVMLGEYYLAYTVVTRVPHMPTLSDAIAAVKAGRNQEARHILTAILANDPQNIPALLWMTPVAQTINERREYLRRVLAIDPNNAPAQKGLAILGETDEVPPWMYPERLAGPNPSSETPANEALVTQRTAEVVAPKRSRTGRLLLLWSRFSWLPLFA